MQVISLKEFALTGDFGPVKIGMTKEEVLQHLGEPNDEADYGSGYFGLTYSWYELFFASKTGILDSIQNDHLAVFGDHHKESIQFSNEKITIDTWFLNPDEDMTREEVKNFLLDQHIDFVEEEYWGEKIIRFPSGVYLDFYSDDNAEPENKAILNGIRFFPNT